MNDKKEFGRIFIALLLVVSTGVAIQPVEAPKTVTLPDYMAVDINSGLAGEVSTPSMDYSSSTNLYKADTPPVGTTVWDWYLSAIGASPYMTLRAVVGKAEVWVADDLSFPDGDPRNDNPIDWTVIDDMIQYLAEEFDTVIYPTDTTYFGTPFDRDGTNTIFELIGWPPFTYDWIETSDPYDPQRVIIKVLNIRDTNYYDPSYPYFVGGFFSPTYAGYYNRNMVHIDCWEWWRRVGPEGQQWYSEYPDLIVERPFDYEGLIAHEYEHLIHYDVDPDEVSFVDEGMADMAGFLCGYGHNWGHLNRFLYTPDNSLTEWGDQGDINILADYGAAYLFALYIHDHFGGPTIISTIVAEQANGEEGINNALADQGFTDDFNDVFYRWTIANLIHMDEPGGGLYNYDSIDFAEATPATTRPVPHRWTAGTDLGNTITMEGYDTGIAELGTYGTDYIFTKYLDEPGELFFDGDDVAPLGWHLVEADGSTLWYSDGVDLGDFLLSTTVDVPTEAPVLTLDTSYDIEEFWDFGFVQVSTDGGTTWASLENEFTTYLHDPSAHPDIIANLPGLTGTSLGWMTMEFDLSFYAGNMVVLGFRYMTDWATLHEGWYVDNVRINGETIPNEAFVPHPPYPEADFSVTILGVEKAKGPKGLGIGSGKMLIIEDGDIVSYIGTVPLDDLSETGTFDVGYTMEFDYLVLIVSADHGPVDYIFKFDYQNG